MGNHSTHEEREKKIQEFEEEFGESRLLSRQRSASFDDHKAMLDKPHNLGMDSSHGVLRRVYVEVPKGVRTGQYFTVHVNGQDLEVMCPPALSRVSNRIIVELPIDSNPALVAGNLPEKSEQSASEKAKSEKSDSGKHKKIPKRFYVTVPKGMRSGKHFPVHVKGFDLMVMCPPAYSRISDRIIVEVPDDILTQDQIIPGQEPEIYKIVRQGSGSEVQSEDEGVVSGRPRLASNPEVVSGPLNHANHKQESKRVYVSIPKGTRSGQKFHVHVHGHDLEVTCPPAYSRISDRVLVELPSSKPSSEAGDHIPEASLSHHGGHHMVAAATALSHQQGRSTRSVQSAPDGISLETVPIATEGSAVSTSGADSVFYSASTPIVSGGGKTDKKALLKDSE